MQMKNLQKLVILIVFFRQPQALHAAQHVHTEPVAHVALVVGSVDDEASVDTAGSWTHPGLPAGCSSSESCGWSASSLVE